MSAVMMVREDRLDVDPKVFTPGHVLVLRDAAQEPAVQRIFVNAAIKKALCREAKGDRSWLSKIRPWWGHDYHFHIRMRCPPGSHECEGQPSQSEGRLQAGRPCLLVQGFGSASQAAGETSEAETADDAGADARRLQSGAECAGGEAIAPQCCFHPALGGLIGIITISPMPGRRHVRMKTMKGPSCDSVHATRSRAPSSK